jgi:hypothetical protein
MKMRLYKLRQCVRLLPETAYNGTYPERLHLRHWSQHTIYTFVRPLNTQNAPKKLCLLEPIVLTIHPLLLLLLLVHKVEEDESTLLLLMSTSQF